MFWSFIILITGIGLAFALPALFMWIIPWYKRREFRKYFDMDVVPENDAEKRFAKSYLTARLRQYNAAYNAVDVELKHHLELPETSDRAEVESRIGTLREIRKRLTSAEAEYESARRIYESFYPVSQMRHGGVGGQVRA